MAPPGPLTPGEARIVDPVLTSVARGYRNEAHASTVLFPIVPVELRAGKVIEFGAEAFADVEAVRAPGADRQEVQVGYGAQDYQLVQRALDGKVPIETLQEASRGPGLDVGLMTTRMTAEIVMQKIEIEAARVATTAANYAAGHWKVLAGQGLWSDFDNSDPGAEVDAARKKVAEGIGREPNVLVMGPEVERKVMRHPKIIEQIKHTRGLQDAAMGQQLVTAPALAAYFGIERVVVARARKGKAGDFQPVWGKDVVVAYSALGSVAARGVPSFGYTYRLTGYPVASPAYYDAKKESWLYPYTSEDTPVLCGSSAGFLLKSAIA